MLAKTLGVKKLIIAINKMDDPTVSCPCPASAACQPAWRTWLRADVSRAPARHVTNTSPTQTHLRPVTHAHTLARGHHTQARACEAPGSPPS